MPEAPPSGAGQRRGAQELSFLAGFPDDPRAARRESSHFLMPCATILSRAAPGGRSMITRDTVWATAGLLGIAMAVGCGTKGAHAQDSADAGGNDDAADPDVAAGDSSMP